MLLTVAPLGLAVAAWVPDVSFAALAGVATSIGLTIVLAEIARDAGVAAQQRLVREWGGLPTMQMMRHGDPRLNAETRRRYHVKLGALMRGTVVPTEASQALDPEGADAIYASCGDYLRGQTRERAQFALVFEENVSYGFRRNLWAMKPGGLWLAGAAAIACGLRAWMRWHATGDVPDFPVVAALANAWWFTTWVFVVTKRWVHRAAEAYARQLLAACDQLPGVNHES